jgi:hypothetical protein
MSPDMPGTANRPRPPHCGGDRRTDRIGPPPASDGIYLTSIVDVAATDEVIDHGIDRQLELGIGPGLPI